MLWNNCKYDAFFYDDIASCDNPCSVEIRDDYICVSYDDQDEHGRQIITHYEGKEIGKGHFELSSYEKNGRATLHMFDNSIVLEGFWVEGGYRGMWRVSLA